MGVNQSIPNLHHLQRAAFMILTVGLLATSGCGSKPNAANIQLRKQNQELSEHIASLEAERDAQFASLRMLEQGIPTVPILPAERINELFTAKSLKTRKLTGKADLDPAKAGDDGLKVYVVPIDASGDEIKAAGSFKVEAFDLSAPNTRVGEWNFSIDQSRATWNGSGLLYEYVLPCPFDAMPDASELTMKITFTDALTQRVLSLQQVVKWK